MKDNGGLGGFFNEEVGDSEATRRIRAAAGEILNAPEAKKGDLSTAMEAEASLKQLRFRNILPFLGPAFIACVAYIDPGNFATNIAGGSQYGYTLLWVIIASNIIAILVQAISAKLGLATGKNLAEHIRLHTKKPVTIATWIMMEIVIMATDLAEFLGAALGIQLLFGLPLWIGGLITLVITFVILGLQRFGFRTLETVITAFVLVVAISYIVELFMARPEWQKIGFAIVNPSLPDTNAIFIAVGILGATVMPHAIYLHSALMQNRILPVSNFARKRLFRFELIDVFIAMGLASFVNMAMLVMAAATFHSTGRSDVASIETAYETLTPLLGNFASIVFGISLLASGLSSSAVGTSAGQIVMQGFLNRRIPVLLRRIITVIPAMVVILLGIDPTATLVLSQVLLSMGLPVTLYFLFKFTSSASLMGNLRNRMVTRLALGLSVFIVSFLNLYLIYQTLRGS